MEPTRDIIAIKWEWIVSFIINRLKEEIKFYFDSKLSRDTSTYNEWEKFGER